MRLRIKQHRPSPELGMAPLIDVILLLIIFFMLVSEFSRVEIVPLSLPEAQKGQTPAPAVEVKLIINLNEHGQMMISGQPHTMESFSYLLQQEMREKPQRDEVTVLIRADRLTPWRYIRTVMEKCGQQGINQVRVAVVQPDSETAQILR